MNTSPLSAHSYISACHLVGIDMHAIQLGDKINAVACSIWNVLPNGASINHYEIYV